MSKTEMAKLLREQMALVVPRRSTCDKKRSRCVSVDQSDDYTDAIVSWSDISDAVEAVCEASNSKRNAGCEHGQLGETEISSLPPGRRGGCLLLLLIISFIG